MMNKTKEPIVLTEYHAIVSKEEYAVSGDKYLEPELFSKLEEFILSNKGTEAQPIELMSITSRKGVGKVIVAKNYVGVITFNNGRTIEILPKIVNGGGKEEDVKKVKSIFIKMLKALKNAPFKTMQSTNVDTLNMNIFEIFIRLFIDEVFDILRRGLVGGYKTVENNEKFFKGKLLISEQIKYNAAHAERLFVEYEEFNFDNAENRLLKSTLKYLHGKTVSSKNKADIVTLLTQFDEIAESTDFAGDFERAPKSRSNAYYQTALSWAKVFLQGKTFITFAGKEYAQALLFPMEKLFESYVAKELGKVLSPKGYRLSSQHRGYYLFEQVDGLNRNTFALRPDIVITKNTDTGYMPTWIMDTKWKVVDDAGKLSQGDMYQMYAYHNKYKAYSGHDPESVTLLYPQTGGHISERVYSGGSKDKVQVRIRFVDLTKPAKEWYNIVDEFSY